MFQQAPIVPSPLNALCDSTLDQMVLKALAPDRANRYRTAKEFLSDLERWAPLLTLTGASNGKGASLFETSKTPWESRRPANEEIARHMAAEAVSLAQHPGMLSEDPEHDGTQCKVQAGTDN